MSDFEFNIRAAWTVTFPSIKAKGCHFNYAKVKLVKLFVIRNVCNLLATLTLDLPQNVLINFCILWKGKLLKTYFVHSGIRN